MVSLKDLKPVKCQRYVLYYKFFGSELLEVYLFGEVVQQRFKTHFHQLLGPS